MPAWLVAEQIAAVVEDIPPAAAKTGALGSAEVVEVVARAAADFAFPLVVDPVMVSTSGRPLLPPDAVRAIRELLLPYAALATPNVPEAEALTGIEIHGIEEARRAACVIRSMGARAVLIKGGHLESENTDVLFDGVEYREFLPRVSPRRTLTVPGAPILRHRGEPGCRLRSRRRGSAIQTFYSRGHP